MAKDTNAEQALAGEASSSSRKRQRLPSTIEDEAEAVQEEIENVEGTASGNRNTDGDAVTAERVSGTLFDLDLLECPICSHAPTTPIFQCDNGHIACSSCCNKVRNQCPECTLPIGYYRNRRLEKLVESIFVPCTNAKHGCTEKFSYDKAFAHEKECRFALCYCPKSYCNYSGVYKDLYRHYYAKHKEQYTTFSRLYSNHSCILGVLLRLDEKILVLQECPKGQLVAIQCFEEPQGIYVTVNCIAPSAPGIGKLSYRLSYSLRGNTMTFESKEMKRIQKVSFQTPEKDFMLVPHYFLNQFSSMKIEIYICRLEGEEVEEEEAEEEETDEEETDDEETDEEEAEDHEE